jgi:type VI protein secretion system component Hcp
VRKTVLSTVVISGVLLAATASLAASDYYIKFDGVDGESKSRAKAETIELQSWSFGTSQASVVAPRDAASGLATGKRQHKPMTVTKPIEADAAARVATPAAGEIRTVTFAVPEPGDASTAQLARLCASGKPVKSAVLNGPDGRYQMKDVVVSSCAVNGNERRYELKGHDTLMK